MFDKEEYEGIFKDIITQYNQTQGLEKHLILQYNIYNCTEYAVIYDLKLTNVLTNHQTSMPSFMFPNEDTKEQILQTASILEQFIELIAEHY